MHSNLVMRSRHCRCWYASLPREEAAINNPPVNDSSEKSDSGALSITRLTLAEASQRNIWHDHAGVRHIRMLPLHHVVFQRRAVSDESSMLLFHLLCSSILCEASVHFQLRQPYPTVGIAPSFAAVKLERTAVGCASDANEGMSRPTCADRCWHDKA